MGFADPEQPAITKNIVIANNAVMKTDLCIRNLRKTVSDRIASETGMQ